LIYTGKNANHLSIIDLEHGTVIGYVSEADTDTSVLTEYKKLSGDGLGSWSLVKRVCAFDVFDQTRGYVIDKGRP
jgi:hypothetical protein